MGEFKIKSAINNFILRPIYLDECVELNLNDYKLTTYNFNMSFTFKNIKYNININNVSYKYVNNPKLLSEYCKNILYNLVEEEHEFINGEVIDFQKYLI